MKLQESEIKESEKLSRELSEFDEKNKGRLEEEVKKADEKIIEGKKKFDELKLLGGPNLWQEWTEFEKLLIKRRQIEENYRNEKSKLEIRLRAITSPVIESYVLDLLQEVKRINGLKKFETVVEKEDVHSDREGRRIFTARHNYFRCHAAQKEILAGIDELRSMELESLSRIKKRFDEVTEAIPTTFPFEETTGNASFQEFIYSNRPVDFSPDPEKIWLFEAKAKADLLKNQSIIDYWRNRVTKRSKPHQKPIIDDEIDMTYLYK